MPKFRVPSLHRELKPAIVCIIFCCLAAPAPLSAQSVPYPTARYYHETGAEPPEHQVDMRHLRIELSFVPQEGLVKGHATHVFVPIRDQVDSLFFHGPGIHVLRASLNNTPVQFTTTPAGITLHPSRPMMLGTIDSVTFEYEAHPRRGLYFIGWNDTTGRRHKQIWSQGQGIDNRNWFPCYDEQNDKLITETIVTFDSSYQVLSNGSLLDVHVNRDGTRTWHYSMTHPHSAYLVMLGIGKYDIETRYTRTGVPVRLYSYPERPDRVAPTYLYSAESVDFIADHTGIPFPWESYANIPVEDFLYGAMENTTATVYGDFLLVDRRGFHDRNYLGVNVHELAHQWFGDFVTGRAPNMAWLHESFATFYPKLFLKSVYGEDYYEWMRRLEQNIAIAASEQNRLPLVHSAAGSPRVYQKGSAVLDMMMDVVGENAFRRVIHFYLTHHAYGLVETNDLYQAFQDTLGLSPAWFFDEWIYRGGEPEYEVRYQDVAVMPGKARQTEITVQQNQQLDELTGLFSMPITFEVHYTDGSFDRVRQNIAGQTERVVIANPHAKSIAFVLFDPGSMILKKITFPKSFDELRQQALKAPLMIDRYDAVFAMRSLDQERKRAVLLQIYDKEKFPSLRAEAAAQLAEDSSNEARKFLPHGLRDPEAEVRTAIFEHVGAISPRLRPDFELLINDSSYTLATAALRRMSALFPERIPEYLAWTKNDEGIGNQVRVAWHEINATHGGSASRDTLVNMCGPSWEFRTRLNAMESVRRLNMLTPALVGNLFDAALNSNGRLRGPAVSLLQYFRDQSAYHAMIGSYYQARSWEPWQRDILRPLAE